MAAFGPKVDSNVEIHAVSQCEERAEHAGMLHTERSNQLSERLITTSQTFRQLYDWSVGEKRTDFWEDMWDASGLIYEGSYTKVRP